MMNDDDDDDVRQPGGSGWDAETVFPWLTVCSPLRVLQPA